MLSTHKQPIGHPKLLQRKMLNALIIAEQRARRAILYFQNAASAGHDNARKEINEAFHFLSVMYETRHKYAENLHK
ncbi:MAG: hypothetical protein M1836_005213 [Candelina mexicana]|nr:MAG: hypothetical protein M1836_005213 [Candelina mexicana]